MSVYAEWWWHCDDCGEECEEPWGDEDAAAAGLAEHQRECPHRTDRSER